MTVAVGGKTPLTYYGGKQRLAPQIIEHLPQHRNYVEPYAGGLAVLFAKQPSEREVVNDLDGEVANFWCALREFPEDLATAVAATPYSREEWETSGICWGGHLSAQLSAPGASLSM